MLTFHPAAVGVSAIKHKENIHFRTCMSLAAGRKQDGSHVRPSLQCLTNIHLGVCTNKCLVLSFFFLFFHFKLRPVSPFLFNDALILLELQYAATVYGQKYIYGNSRVLMYCKKGSKMSTKSEQQSKCNVSCCANDDVKGSEDQVVDVKTKKKKKKNATYSAK